MHHLLLVFLVLLGVWSFHRQARTLIWLSSIVCALSVVGCVAEPVGPSHQFTQDRVRAVCWKPPELAPGTRYFVIPDGTAVAVSEKNPDFDLVIEANGIVYEYDPYAPAGNLRFLPLSRTDAWCTAIPKPTDEKVLRFPMQTRRHRRRRVLDHGCAGPLPRSNLPPKLGFEFAFFEWNAG